MSGSPIGSWSNLGADSAHQPLTARLALMFGLKSATPSRPNLTGDRVRVLRLRQRKQNSCSASELTNKAHLQSWEPARTRAFLHSCFLASPARSSASRF